MKRPLALIGINYMVFLTFLNLIPNEFTNYLVYVFAALFFVSVIFKRLRNTWVLPVCFATCLTCTLIQLGNISKINEIQKWCGKEQIVSGKIYDIPYVANDQYGYILKLNSINQEPVPPFLVNLTSSFPLEGDIYSEFTGKVKFEAVSDKSKIYYNSKNIFIVAKMSKNQTYNITDPCNEDWYYHVLRLRQKTISTPREFLNPNIYSVINAILLGEKGSMPENIKKDFQKIGVYHLLATSGMHVAIISQFIFYLFKKLKIKEKPSALLSCLSMLLFMAIVGFTPTITRACTMAIIYFLGICISKRADPLNSLGIAVLIICAINPFAACDISLWLSFLATLGIILCYHPIKNYIYQKLNNPKSVLCDYIVSTLSVTICAFIFTLPIVILSFKKISIISPLSNLLFIPCVNIILNLSAILNALKLAGMPNLLLSPIAAICGYIVHSLIKIAELLANIPYAYVSLKYQESYIWLIFTMVLLALVFIIKPTQKAFIISALLSINAALSLVIMYQILNHDKLTISFTPCGNGICAILSKNNHLAAVSCVSDDSEIENISDTISDSYIKNLDYLNLSVEKHTETNTREIYDLIEKHPPSNITLNFDSPIKLKIKDGIAYYKSNSKTTFWEDITITNLKIDDHIYIKIDTPKLNILIFPNGGDAKILPNDWKSCQILVANGLPVNYSCIKFEKTIISSKSKDSSINVSKLLQHGKNAISLYDQGEIYIKTISKEKYKLGRLA